MVNRLLGVVKGQAFGKSFAKNMVHVKAKRHIHMICDTLGTQRIEWMIVNNRSLLTLLNKTQESQLRQSAPAFQWAEAAISDEDFVGMFPEWTTAIIKKHGEQGQLWLTDTVKWIRGFFYSSN